MAGKIGTKILHLLSILKCERRNAVFRVYGEMSLPGMNIRNSINLLIRIWIKSCGDFLLSKH